MTDISEVARALALARKSGAKLAGYPGPKPSSFTDAWQLQAEVTRALSWKPCGWKAGATSPTAQALLHVEGPYIAPLYLERAFPSGAEVQGDGSTRRIVEPEIAFVMGADLPLRDQPYESDEVLSAVASAHAALELVSSRLPHGLDEPIEWIVADGGINDAIVLGPAVSPLSAAGYAALNARARRNGEWITAGMGGNVMGGPDNVLTWVANHLREREIALREGHIVTTGLVTELIRCQRGDEIEACFDRLGCVRVRCA